MAESEQQKQFQYFKRYDSDKRFHRAWWYAFKRPFLYFWQKLSLIIKKSKKQDQFKYFQRYDSDKRFHLAWWYALGHAFLYFWPTLGMMFSAVTTLLTFEIFLNFTTILSLLLSPVSLTLLALIVFSLITIVLSYYKFCEVFEKCRKAYKDEIELQKKVYKLRRIIEYFVPNPPDNWDAPLDPAVPPIPSWRKRIKPFIFMIIFNIFGSIGWLDGFKVCFGIPLFLVTMGPFATLAICIAFILLNLLAVIWVEGIADVRFDHHHAKEVRATRELEHQIRMLDPQVIDFIAKKETRLHDGLYDFIENGVKDGKPLPEGLISDKKDDAPIPGGIPTTVNRVDIDKSILDTLNPPLGHVGHAWPPTSRTTKPDTSPDSTPDTESLNKIPQP